MYVTFLPEPSGAGRSFRPMNCPTPYFLWTMYSPCATRVGSTEVFSENPTSSTSSVTPVFVFFISAPSELASSFICWYFSRTCCIPSLRRFMNFLRKVSTELSTSLDALRFHPSSTNRSFSRRLSSSTASAVRPKYSTTLIGLALRSSSTDWLSLSNCHCFSTVLKSSIASLLFCFPFRINLSKVMAALSETDAPKVPVA
mmetsp:Transcript_45719/g.76185  ORF Transcript_45719/g.76185 Transcript_45719/m.76185 type:complete len:200 (-) Transcript_45719:188-787(-)